MDSQDLEPPEGFTREELFTLIEVSLQNYERLLGEKRSFVRLNDHDPMFEKKIQNTIDIFNENVVIDSAEVARTTAQSQIEELRELQEGHSQYQQIKNTILKIIMIQAYYIQHDRQEKVKKRMTEVLQRNKQPVENIEKLDEIERLKITLEKNRLQQQKKMKQYTSRKPELFRKANDNYNIYDKDIKTIQKFRQIAKQKDKNLQYYGFRAFDSIKYETFRNFTIEDDSFLKKSLQQSDFFSQKFEFSFRTIALGIIFSAVKKHNRIQNALQHIKKLVNDLALNQSNHQKKRRFWSSNSPNIPNYLNEIYILYNILRSSKRELRVEFMSIYKELGPLFIFMKGEEQKIDLREEHFWIYCKSFVVTSISIRGKVRGKSKFLNYLFNLNIPLADKRHPSCHNSVMINYNVYNNERILVDVVDVSNQSLSQGELQSLCNHSNLLIIHAEAQNLQKCQKWRQAKAKNIPSIIIIIKNSSEQLQFHKQQNRFEAQRKACFQIPSLCQQKNISFHKDHLSKVFNQINKIIVGEFRRSARESSQFINYLALSKQSRQQLDTLEKVEKQIQAIPYSKQPIIPQALVKFIQFSNDIEFVIKLIFKIKQWAKIFRGRRSQMFEPIFELLKLTEQGIPIHQQKTSNFRETFDKLNRIQENYLTAQFRQKLNDLKNITTNFSTQNMKQVEKIAEFLKNNYLHQIKPRQFSAQNLWRGLGIVSQANIDHMDRKIKLLFHHQFIKGQQFELVNGESLEIPFHILNSIKQSIGNKKVMVIAIFGPQSSGKSTILNFLFGTDFLTSEGRCTSGIYGTYYQIQNRIFPFEGVIVLDTEGLFSTYKREIDRGQNFDNKLILFLLKVCDIVILNMRGDVDRNSVQILKVSFDSVLMKKEEGIYPNFYIVKNQTFEDTNQQQSQEIKGLISEILKTNEFMKGYISTGQTKNMKTAFEDRQGINEFSEELNKYIKKTKIVKKDFYERSKQISNQLIQKLKERVKSERVKTLSQIFENFNAVWLQINYSPILTRHKSIMQKEFEQQLDQNIVKHISKIEALIKDWIKQTPNSFEKIDLWLEKKLDELDHTTEGKTQQMEQENPENEYRKQRIVEKKIQNLKKNCNQQRKLFIRTIKQEKIRLQFEQRKNRGVYAIVRKAKALRQQSINQNMLGEQRIIQQFQTFWKNYTKEIYDSFKIEVIEKQKYQQLKQLYQRKIKRLKILQTQERLPNLHITYSQFSEKNKKELLNSDSFADYFNFIKALPTIVLRDQQTSLKFDYLNMKKYFFSSERVIQLFFPQQKLNELINFDVVHEEITERVSESQKVIEIVDNLLEDLKWFGIKVKQAQRRNIHQYISRNLFYLYKKAKVGSQADDKGMDKLSIQKICEYDQQQTNKKLKEACQSNHIQYQMKIISLPYLKSKIGKQKDADFLQRTIKQYLISSFSLQADNQIKVLIENAENLVSEDICKEFQKIGFNVGPQNLKIVYYNDVIQGGISLIEIRMEVSAGQDRPRKYSSRQEIISVLSQLTKKIKSSFLQMNWLEGPNKEISLLNNPIKFGIYQQEQLMVKKQYENVLLLKSYAKKDFEKILKEISSVQFRDFIFGQIKKERLVDKISEFLTNSTAQQLSAEKLVEQLQNTIQSEVGLMNSDLRQISHEISYNFEVKIHQFAFVSFAQKVLLQIQKQTKLKQQNFEKFKGEQFKIFKQLIVNPSQDNANAALLVQQYRNFLTDMVQKKKQIFLKEQLKKFLMSHTRRNFEKEIVDRFKRQESFKTEQNAYKYLTQPLEFLKSQQQSKINKHITDYFSLWSSIEINIAIEEVKKNIRNMAELCSRTNYEADIIVQQNSKAPSEILFDILIELFLQQDSISQSYKENMFSLKQSVLFENLLFVKDQKNKQFFERMRKFENIEISNFSKFMQDLKEKIEDFNIVLSITEEEKSKFKNDAKITFCTQSCAFCGRLCDVEVRESSKHTHECSKGHQMRAIKGFRHKVKQENKICQYSSLAICNNISQDTMMLFEGRNIIWKDHKENQTNWSFESQYQQKLVEDLWETSGEKICKQFSINKEMKFISFSKHRQKIKILTNHFIFAIDGSTTMATNNKWNTQIEQLTIILRKIGNNYLNRVSIIVFNDQPNIIVQNSDPHYIYPKTFKFPSGGTTKEAIAAFGGAITVMKKNEMKVNTHFIYISDGHGEHPTQQIQQMLRIKKELKNKNQSIFTYTSILIGKSQLGKAKMDKINEILEGNSRWGTAQQISTAFMQVYYK